MDNKKETFGDRFRYLRLEKGLSQIELAKQLQVSKSVISLWELNGSDPTLTNLIKISEFFNVSIDYLAGIEH
ncbi:MAG: helix-turn-helix transcriptional regulator [Clostridia bacterium]|nr:helix-turn-helix transcriptional regulator [Clostridia bacterium]